MSFSVASNKPIELVSVIDCDTFASVTFFWGDDVSNSVTFRFKYDEADLLQQAKLFATAARELRKIYENHPELDDAVGSGEYC